jgi:hypothetical protein
VSAATGIRWRRASRGLAIAGFGVFLLLTTQGVLSWSFWARAATFWPVLLVAVGARMVLERFLGPPAALVSPVVVLGTLALVATSDHAPPLPQGEWREVEAERPAAAESWELDVQLAMSQVRVRGAELPEDRLVAGRRKGDGSWSVRVSERDGSARVRVRGGVRHRGPFAWRGGVREVWELDLARELPLRADIEGAFLEGELDLAELALTRLEIEGAFNDLELILGEPAEDVRLELNGAFNDYQLVVPETIPVRIDADGPFNLVDDRASPHSGGPGYRVRLEGAFNSVSLSSD